MSVWAEYDKKVDLDGMQKDIEVAANSSGGDYKEVPHGTYEVTIEKFALVESSKKKKPMVSIWFNIEVGEYKGSKIFYNQVIKEPFQIHMANEFMKSLDTPVTIEFKSYAQYDAMIAEVKADTDNCTYVLAYQNKKGYNVFSIEDIFDKE